MYLCCPACRDLVLLPPEADGGQIVLVESDALECFVHDHVPHLADDDYLYVMESAGDC
jgi:hypothetical protein